MYKSSVVFRTGKMKMKHPARAVRWGREERIDEGKTAWSRTENGFHRMVESDLFFFYLIFHLTFMCGYIMIEHGIILVLCPEPVLRFIPFLLDSLREPLYIDILPYYHFTRVMLWHIFHIIIIDIILKVTFAENLFICLWQWWYKTEYLSNGTVSWVWLGRIKSRRCHVWLF